MRVGLPARALRALVRVMKQINAARPVSNGWMFTTEKARAKMGRAYPQPAAVRDPQTKES